jgi:hypothetical protein
MAQRLASGLWLLKWFLLLSLAVVIIGFAVLLTLPWHAPSQLDWIGIGVVYLIWKADRKTANT